MPDIRTMLDLSTAHLPEQICDRLGAIPGVVAHETVYGSLMWVPNHPGVRDTARIGHQHRGLAAHRGERGTLHNRRQSGRRHVDAERGRDVSHLARQADQKIVVVHQ